MCLLPDELTTALNFLSNLSDEQLHTQYGIVGSDIPARFASSINNFSTAEDLITNPSIQTQDINNKFDSQDLDLLTGIKNSESGIQTRYVTVGDPDDDYYVVKPGEIVDGVNLDGVGYLTMETSEGLPGNCTGSLLSTGKHILTAAHCLIDVKAENIKVTFHLPDGDVNIPARTIFIHPQYVNQKTFHDIAILELAELAPNNIPRYDIYRGNKEVGQVHLKAGYGLTGQGKMIDDLSLGIKRAGHNIYDSLLNPNQFSNQGKFEEIFPEDIPPNTQLAYDFDNGKPENDAFGKIFGKVNLGLGKDEVTSAQGDSGGPTFINNKIVGVTSYGLGDVTTDIDNNTNSSYGEFTIDTRVAAYTQWIDKIVSGKKPTNDSFSSAIKLTGDSLQIKSDNILATQEGLDPSINSYKLKNTVWWKWQAPRNMSVNLNTFGSNFNTLLGVYTKNAQGLNFVKFSNDAYDRKQSQVIFNAQSGKTYYFVVDGLTESNQGDITLNLKEGSQPYLPKSDDFFVKATVLKGQYVEVTSNNALATAERRDPKMFGNPPLQTVWWKWQAPRNMKVNLNTFGSDFDTILGVYTKNTDNNSTGFIYDTIGPQDLTLLRDNNDNSYSQQSQVIFDAEAGKDYWFVVDRYSVNSEEGGDIKLNLRPFNSNSYFDYNYNADYDRDLDLLWRNQKNGQNQVWLMKSVKNTDNGKINMQRQSLLFLPDRPDKNWAIAGTGLFDNDNKPDLVWHNKATGENQLWLMGTTDRINSNIKSEVDLPKQTNLAWQVVGTDDLYEDGNTEIVLRTNLDWQIVATDDMNQDGKIDLVWRNQKTGQNQVWLMNGTKRQAVANLPNRTNLDWQLEGVGDWNNDRKSDILWRNKVTGANQVWLMNGLVRQSSVNIKSEKSSWQIVGTGDVNLDNTPDIIWRNPTNGANRIWLMNGTKFSEVVTMPIRSSKDWQMIV